MISTWDKNSGQVQQITDLVVLHAEIVKLRDQNSLMYQWLKRHYQQQEGPGETNRQEYFELRELLKKLR